MNEESSQQTESSSVASGGSAADGQLSSGDANSGSTSCSGSKPANWIEIELYDPDGEPVPKEPYKIVLPDKAVVEGKLDDKGHARHEDIPRGNCEVSFPERSPLDPRDNPKDSIDLQLIDEDEKPCAKEPYLIVFADGTQLNGKLDDQGKLEKDDVPPGFFRIYFPERPHHYWEVVP